MLEVIRTKIKDGTKKVKETAVEVNKQIRKHIITAITAAFAFIIALFWRDAIQGGINKIIENIGANGDSYIYKIISALIVTVICVIGIVFFARLEKKDLSEETKEDEKKKDKKA